MITGSGIWVPAFAGTTATGNLPDSGSRSRRLHAPRFEHLGGGRAREPLEQGIRSLALFGLRANPGGVDGVVLDVRRQRAHQRDALHGEDFADLVNAELGLALRDVLRHRAAGNELCLGVHVGGDPELIEKTGDVDAARATGGRIDIGNGLGGEQRLLEGRDRADVRLRRALLDYDADADAREVHPTTGDELAFVREIVDRRGREHREVERLAALDALAQRADGIVLDGDLVAGGSLEVG